MIDRAFEPAQNELTCGYRILRYNPYMVRDEWLNIGVLVFDPQSGACRLRLIEEQEEFARVRRLHPGADEVVLRLLRGELEDRAESRGTSAASIEALVQKWDNTLACSVQFSPQRGVISRDLESELDRIYTDMVAIPRSPVRTRPFKSRAQMRSYCSQVLQQARIWDKMRRSVRASEFTYPGDPTRIDFGYRRNGTLGFVHALPIARALVDVKSLAYTAKEITVRSPLKTEFLAVTDIELAEQKDRDRFVSRTLREAGIEPLPLDHFAVWVAKLKPMIQ